MGEENRDREEGPVGGDPHTERQAGDLSGSRSGELDPEVTEPQDLPDQSPLFHAQHAARYERQQLIGAYEDAFGCRLVVLIDAIFPFSVTYFEELIFDADPSQDLHLLLASPGGDGETAIRLVRAAQSRCRELVVIVPDVAKSAATLLAMGAHRLLMGPTSDLGPVDPQFQLPSGALAAAKDIIAAVDDATAKVEQSPDTYPIHAALLGDITALMVQQARSALARTTALVEEALSSCTGRGPNEVADLRERLREPLIDLPTSHAAVFGATDAEAAGLPVEKADPRSHQWQLLWRLWAKYFAMGPPRVYEGRKASHVLTWPQLEDVEQ
jgi:hypothetical protein